LVKDFTENSDQEVIFDKLSGILRRLIESCYRRSFTMPDSQYGQLLSILNQVHNETYTQSQNMQPAMLPNMPATGFGGQ